MAWYGVHPWKYVAIAAAVGTVLGGLWALALGASGHWLVLLPLSMAMGGGMGAFFDSRAQRARGIAP